MLRNRLHRHLAYKQNLIERSWYWIFKKSWLQSWGDLPYFVRKTLCRQYVGWSNTLISKDLDPFDTSGYLNLCDVKSINLYFKNCKRWKINLLCYRKMSFKNDVHSNLSFSLYMKRWWNNLNNLGNWFQKYSVV